MIMANACVFTLSFVCVCVVSNLQRIIPSVRFPFIIPLTTRDDGEMRRLALVRAHLVVFFSMMDCHDVGAIPETFLSSRCVEFRPEKPTNAYFGFGAKMAEFCHLRGLV